MESFFLSKKDVKSSEYEGLRGEEGRGEVIERVAKAFGDFLVALGIDWESDVHMRETPMRVARMYVEEWLRGRFYPEPIMRFFECLPMEGFLVQGPIVFRSLCPHHFVPFFGFVSVCLASSKEKMVKTLGVSKYARLVGWYSSKAYMQEDLGGALLRRLVRLTGLDEVAVCVCARHSCCTHRGVEQVENQTVTWHSTKAFEKHVGLKDYFYNITQEQIKKFSGQR